MDCEQARDLISADVDREIDPAERPMLDAHLTECSACRDLASTFRLQDAELRRVFAPRREAAVAVSDHVISQLRTDVQLPTAGRPVPSRAGWISMSLSAATGFLLAVILFRPWQPALPPLPQKFVEVTDVPRSGLKDESPLESADEKVGADHKSLQPQAAPEPVLPNATAQLAYSSGVIELLRPGSQDWGPMQTGESIASGTRVRTGATGRCEFRTVDGSLVRLNHQTELLFQTHRTLELTDGQIWSQVEKADVPFEVRIPRELACVTALGTRFDVVSREAETLLTVVEGSTRLAGKGWEEVIRKGQKAMIVRGVLGETTSVQNLAVATSWVHEILKLKGPDNPEFTERMDDLLAQIGQGKMTYLPEKEILQLGDHCVLPLTCFIQSERSRNEPQRRRNAARILAKIAQPWSIPELINLLGDQDGTVRAHAAKGLGRLTDGVTQGLAPEAWRNSPDEIRESALQKWQSWWKTNQGKYPAPPYLEQPPALDRAASPGPAHNTPRDHE